MGNHRSSGRAGAINARTDAKSFTTNKRARGAGPLEASWSADELAPACRTSPSRILDIWIFTFPLGDGVQSSKKIPWEDASSWILFKEQSVMWVKTGCVLSVWRKWCYPRHNIWWLYSQKQMMWWPTYHMYIYIYIYISICIFIWAGVWPIMIFLCEIQGRIIRWQILKGCMVTCDDISYHIEAETKWPPFRRRHFQVHFHEWKLLNFKCTFNELCSL